MATLRKRGGKWQVQIRRKGYSSVSRTFHLKTDALAWARQKELDADRCGLTTEHKALTTITVAGIITRYRDEVVPRNEEPTLRRKLSGEAQSPHTGSCSSIP